MLTEKGIAALARAVLAIADLREQQRREEEKKIAA